MAGSKARTKWGTFSEAVAEVHGTANPYLVMVLQRLTSKPCPSPPWDQTRTYRVALAGGVPRIEMLSDDGEWVVAQLHPPQVVRKPMTNEERLLALKEKLEGTEPFPWSNIETWVSSATPFMRRAYGDFFEDFQLVTRAPRWLELPRVWSDEGDNFDDADAREDRHNSETAQTTKEKIVAFLDGLSGLPEAPVSHTKPAAAGLHITAHGDVNMGPKTDTSFNNSPVGVAATAPGAIASSEGASRERLREDVGRAQEALLADQDKLDEIHELLHDSLSQLLRSVRKTEFAVSESERVLAKMKETVDDIWAQNGLRSVKIPVKLEVAQAILKSPVLATLLERCIE